MLSFTKDKSNCTGCTACMAACPVSCISMVEDSEGFKYPVSSDACIDCGLCERVCPLQKTSIVANPPSSKAYAVLSRDASIWRRSASGGAFSEICNAWGDDKTIIVGATWDGLIVHHKCVEGVKNILDLCKSKYVASSPDNTFREIKDYLINGRKVTFCGTPCQVAGLKSYLRKDYPNLLTIDLICHGVGSPSVFEDAMKSIGEQLDTVVTGYEFRAKRRVYETDHLQKIIAADGIRYMVKDQYIQLFLSQLCLRPCCGKNCIFRSDRRQGDLTIADFKGLTEVFPELIGTKRNYSSLIVNSVKGQDVVTLLSKNAIIKEATIEDIKKFNPLFYRQTWFSEKRDQFFEDYKSNGVAAINRWTKPGIIYKPGIRQHIKNILPSTILRFAYRIFK